MRTAAIALALALASAAVADDCNWGSFDDSRVNYSEGTLNGGVHGTLRSIIAGHGGTVLAGTPLLTSTYLADVDVFYTSLLSTSTGELSSAEQAALQGWISAGGTLVVTADIFPLAAYESFTAHYGVTGYANLGNNSTGTPVGSHPIVTGVTGYRYNTESTYSYGSDALLIGNNGMGDDFMIVMEPGTGFTAGGRILVFGDHNMFADNMINLSDNEVLANNFVEWACETGVALDRSTWGSIKTSF